MKWIGDTPPRPAMGLIKSTVGKFMVFGWYDKFDKTAHVSSLWSGKWRGDRFFLIGDRWVWSSDYTEGT